MTDNNKFIPKVAEVYQVSYLENQQKLKLSPAARQKIIQKHGSNYQSQRLNENYPGYGPMPQSSSDDEAKKLTFSFFFKTSSRVHDYTFEQSGAYFRTLSFKGISNARS